MGIRTDDTIRFLIPINSTEYKKAYNNISNAFNMQVSHAPIPVNRKDNGYLYIWINKHGIECAYASVIHEWFKYTALIKGIEDIDSLPLLYKILK